MENGQKSMAGQADATRVEQLEATVEGKADAAQMGRLEETVDWDAVPADFWD